MTCPVPAFAVQVDIATGTKDDDQIAAAKPVKVLIEPVPDPRWFVLSKTGQLQTFDPDTADSVDTLSPYIDLSGVVRTDGEGGLLGMAFHPDYPVTPEIFLSYTIDHSGPAISRLARSRI